MNGLFKFLLFARIRFSLAGRGGVYFYAVLAGMLSAVIALAFQLATRLILAFLTGADGDGEVSSFLQIPPWRRIFSLAAGGAAAGGILLFAAKRVRKPPTPYMEAVSIGNGYIPVRANLLRSAAAIVTIGSGASIGREGPLVQTAAVFASMAGRRLNMSTPRLRLLVACSAAGAMAAVFHAPMAGALFVCEIVIGIMSMDMLAPLLVASCASYLTICAVGNPNPLYEISGAYLDINAQTALLSALLGAAASLLANLWMAWLAKCRRLLNRRAEFLPLRLAAAGVAVGAIAAYYPEVAGNGAHIIRGLVSMDFSLGNVSAVLALKIFSVALFFGMGAVGGVLTPSLTIGGVFGFIFAQLLALAGVPLGAGEVIGFSLLGMAAFFTTAAAAPLTSLMLVLEFTMAGRMIFPLIIGVLVSHAVSRLASAKSMYAAEAAGGVKSAFNKPLKDVKVGDLFRKSDNTVAPTTLFRSVAKIFLKNPDFAVYVVSRSNRYLGGILRGDVLAFAKSGALSENVIADDIMRSDIPTLSPDAGIVDGVKAFSENPAAEEMPMVEADGKFYGIVNRGDIFMAFAEISARSKFGG